MGKEVRENRAFLLRVSPLPPARLTHFLTHKSTPLSIEQTLKMTVLEIPKWKTISLYDSRLA